jgi:hypothetical protein
MNSLASGGAETRPLRGLKQSVAAIPRPRSFFEQAPNVTSDNPQHNRLTFSAESIYT